MKRISHALKPAPCLQELSNDPLNILRPSTKLQHSLNLASAYCSPPEHHENENRRGRRHDAKPHEPKVCPAIARACPALFFVVLLHALYGYTLRSSAV